MTLVRIACARLSVAVVALLLLARVATAETTLVVYAASSLTDAFRTLASRFEATHPGVHVALDIAGSQVLVARLQQGASADVIATADARALDPVRARLAGEPQRFARNTLVVIVPRADRAHIATLADLARPGLRVVLCHPRVPAGRYARTLLQALEGTMLPGMRAGYAARVLANVVSEEEQVRAVAGKVALGEADAGIVYRSDVTPAIASAVRVLEPPPAAQVIGEDVIAVLHDAPHPAEARTFLDLVRSDEGQRILRAAGFMSR